MAKKDSKKAQSATSAATPAAAASANFDTELDALFSNVKQEVVPAAAAAAKRKRDSEPTSSKKRPSSVKADTVVADLQADSEPSSDDDFDDDASLDLSEIEKEIEEQGLQRGEDEDEEDFEEDGEVDDDGSEGDEEGASADEEEDDEEIEDAPPPVHEALAGKTDLGKRKPLAREEESKETRDKRSIFVGNVPLSALQSKSLTRELKKQVVAMSPYPSVTRIDALRYRSVAFSVPTGDYTGEDTAADEKRRDRARAHKEAVAEAEAAEAGERLKRGQVYLNAKQKRKVAYINQDINEKAKSVNAYVTLEKLTDQDYKKLAAGATSEEGARRITPAVLAALTAARLDDTVFEGRHLRVDLAVPLSLPELVSSGLDKFLTSSASSSSSTPFATSLTRVLGGSGGKSREENSRTLFVGNLDFEADEEDLRALLESLVKQERGPPPMAVSGSNSIASASSILSSLSLPHVVESTEAQAYTNPAWVSSVRLIRDPATQMGKGFGYVRFADEQCVDELMAIFEADEAFLSAVQPSKGGSSTRGGGLNDDGSRREFKRRIKLNKRALRLSRCKATGGGGGGGGANGTPRKSKTNTKTAVDARTPPRQQQQTRRRSMGAPTPGGTSPSASKRSAGAGEAAATGSPAPKSKAKPTSSTTTTTPPVANPPPQRQRTSEELTRLALKRNDPDRQAKRLAKKEKKKSSSKFSEDAAAGKRDRVKLDYKKASSGGGAKGKKRGAERGGHAPPGKAHKRK